MSANDPLLPDAVPELLTREQLCQWLQVSSSTADRWAMDGSGPPYIRLGVKKARGRCLYRKSDVEAWLLACRRSSTSDKS